MLIERYLALKRPFWAKRTLTLQNVGIEHAVCVVPTFVFLTYELVQTPGTLFEKRCIISPTLGVFGLVIGVIAQQIQYSARGARCCLRCAHTRKSLDNSKTKHTSLIRKYASSELPIHVDPCPPRAAVHSRASAHLYDRWNRILTDGSLFCAIRFSLVSEAKNTFGVRSATPPSEPLAHTIATHRHRTTSEFHFTCVICAIVSSSVVLLLQTESALNFS